MNIPRVSRASLAVGASLVLTLLAAGFGNSMAAAGFAAILFFSLLRVEGGLVEAHAFQTLAALIIASYLALESVARLTTPVLVLQPLLVFVVVLAASIGQVWAFKQRAQVLESSPVRELTVALDALIALAGLALYAAGFAFADPLAGLAAAAILVTQGFYSLVKTPPAKTALPKTSRT